MYAYFTLVKELSRIHFFHSVISVASFLCGFVLCIFPSEPLLANSSQPESKETDSSITEITDQAHLFAVEARKYRNQGKIDSCIYANKYSLELFEQVNNCYQSSRIAMLIGIHLSIQTKDHDEAVSYFLRAKTHYDCHKDELLLSKIYSNLGNLYVVMGQFSTSLESYSHALKAANLTGDTTTLISIVHNIAYTYRQVGSFKEALGYYFQALELSKNIDKNDAEIHSNTNVGSIYRELGDVNRALFHFNRAIELWESGRDYDNNFPVAISIASAYYRMKEYDKAKAIYLRILKAERLNPQVYIKAMSGLGNLFVIQAKQDSALLCYHAALNRALSIDDTYEIANSKERLGNLYVRSHRLDTATVLLEQTLEIACSSSLIEIERDVRQTLSLVYAQNGDFKMAYEYCTKSVIIRDSLNSKEQYEKMNKVQEKYVLELNKKDKRIEENNKQIHKIRNNVKIAVLIGLLILAGTIILFLIISKKKQRTLFEAKERLNIMEQEQLQKESEYNQEQLKQYRMNLENRIHLIDKLQEELAVQNRDVEVKGDQYAHLFGSKILTEDDWEEFKKKFDGAYPGYLIRLRNKYSELSKAEERLFLLIKQNFKSKEIADILGVSTITVKKHRQRLRKKLEITSEVKLETFIETFC